MAATWRDSDGSAICPILTTPLPALACPHAAHLLRPPWQPTAHPSRHRAPLAASVGAHEHARPPCTLGRRASAGLLGTQTASMAGHMGPPAWGVSLRASPTLAVPHSDRAEAPALEELTHLCCLNSSSFRLRLSQHHAR